MYRNDNYDIKINIKLDNGLYVFDDESATGKTRLCKELKELRKLGEQVIGYTFNDDKLGINLIELVKTIKPRVILLDRYDMYNGEFNKYFKEWSKNTILLIDCKGVLDVEIDDEWCSINMTEDTIEVEQ